MWDEFVNCWNISMLGYAKLVCSDQFTFYTLPNYYSLYPTFLEYFNCVMGTLCDFYKEKGCYT